MKTLQVFNIYQQYGGEENVVRTLSRLMEGADWRDVFFESRAWANESFLGKLSQPGRTFWNSAALRQMDDVQREYEADVWLFHNVLPVGSLGLFHRARKLGVLVIQYLHNYRPFSVAGTAWHEGHFLEGGFKQRFWPEVKAGTYRGSRLQTLFMSLVLRAYFKTGAVNAVTMWLSQTAFQKAKYVQAGIPAERVEVMAPPREEAPAPVNWNDDGYLLFLGRLVPEKGIRFLLERWERAAQDGKTKLPRLLIAGAGPLEEEVKRRVGGLKDVSYVGEVNATERTRLLEGCSGLVVPSEWWEVFGLVVVEAYEMEKPVVAARVGGLGEIVTAGKTGFQFEAGDGEGLEQAVSDLMKCTQEERRELGRNGRRWVREEMNVERWKERYGRLVQKTVALKRDEMANRQGRIMDRSLLQVSIPSAE
jgi:glycosyltransferase involved in cell wall biosynthesis